MLKLSTALEGFVMDTGSLKSALNTMVIAVYGGVVPQSADAAIVASESPRLATITKDGQENLPLDFELVNGRLEKPAASVWKGAAVAGMPTFFRLQTPVDNNAQSTTLPRAQGLVGDAGADMSFRTMPFTSGLMVAPEKARVGLMRV